MFNNTNSSKHQQIPGYTGHVAQQRFDPQPPVEINQNPPQYQIPGYLGFIPSIKSDNIYGKSYGRITNLVTNNQVQDFNETKPWTTTEQLQLVNQKQVKQLSAAEVVGIQDKYHQNIVPPNDEQKKELPLPGYTGMAQRVVANNIFGQTYANSLKTANNDMQELYDERNHNYNQQSQEIPNLIK